MNLCHRAELSRTFYNVFRTRSTTPRWSTSLCAEAVGFFFATKAHHTDDANVLQFVATFKKLYVANVCADQPRPQPNCWWRCGCGGRSVTRQQSSWITRSRIPIPASSAAAKSRDMLRRRRVLWVSLRPKERRDVHLWCRTLLFLQLLVWEWPFVLRQRSP